MTLAVLDKGRMSMHRRRKVVNAVALTLSLAAMAFGLFWLAWILIETIRLGIGGLAWTVFTEPRRSARRSASCAASTSPSTAS
jgi:phosphate transport system permease protein